MNIDDFFKSHIEPEKRFKLGSTLRIRQSSWSLGSMSWAIQIVESFQYIIDSFLLLFYAFIDSLLQLLMLQVQILFYLRYHRTKLLVICLLLLLPLCEVKNSTWVQTNFLDFFLKRSYCSLDRWQIKKMLVFTIRILQKLSLKTLTFHRLECIHILDLVNFYIYFFYFTFEQHLILV